jgi:hypothetical protein
MHPRHNAAIAEIADRGSGGEMSIPQRTVVDRVFRPPGICLAALATISAFHLVSADNQIPAGFKAKRYSNVWEHTPFSLVAPATSQAQPGTFEKLALVSWLKDEDVSFVQNTETNNENIRIVEMLPNDDPKLIEAIISNGSEKGVVKFRFEVPAIAYQPNAQVPLAMGVPGQAPLRAVPQNGQNPQSNLPGGPNSNSLQEAQPGQVLQAGVPAPQPQNPRMRPAETRHRRILAAPGSGQPLPAPGSAQPAQNW